MNVCHSKPMLEVIF